MNDKFIIKNYEKEMRKNSYYFKQKKFSLFQTQKIINIIVTHRGLYPLVFGWDLEFRFPSNVIHFFNFTIKLIHINIKTDFFISFD